MDSSLSLSLQVCLSPLKNSKYTFEKNRHTYFGNTLEILQKSYLKISFLEILWN
jgi:hypothetical protein